MNFLPALATWQFAAAGAVCATAPILLHLLNRRRVRVVDWGAMSFLREAIQRRRRIMQIRDVILMILRTAAVLLFGLALSRPFLAARQEQLDAGQPVHAVLLIDNSLSMGYQTLEGTLLMRAVERASEFIERLPVGSRISIVPLCGSQTANSLEPLDAKPFALEALQRITVVDRSLNVRQAVNEARRAAELVRDLSQRFVLFTDQQRLNWGDLQALGEQVELPSFQVVDVSAESWDNSWIASVRVPDGIADSDTPTTIQVLVRHHGREPRPDVRVVLWVDGQEVDSQRVSFDTADAGREVTFTYTMRGVQPEPARPVYVPIKVTLDADRLPEDDVRHLLVPVVASLPVVFVDQHGTDEDPVRNRFGETRHLRQLLAPTVVRGDVLRSPIEIRQRTMPELDREQLADARLVIVAGVSSPAGKVSLLREYVEQGGQLLIAAGAEFDPVDWTQEAWLNGDGILPLPLSDELIGARPGSVGRDLQPLSLSFESLGQHPYFQLPGNAEDDLRDLYAEPFFFQAVGIDERADAVAAASRSPATSSSTDSSSTWLLWSPPDIELPGPEPKILARFTSETGPPFLVERSIGRGHVVFTASGLHSNWNTLPKTNAIVMFDRILRSRLQATLPLRNFGGVDRVPIPVHGDVREGRIVLFRPESSAISESLDTGFLRTDQLGVTIDHPLSRGIYRVQSLRSTDNPAGQPDPVPAWQVEIAVNGDEAESDLEPLDRVGFARSPAASAMQWLEATEEISLAGANVRGRDLWWWLALSVFLALVAEQLVVVWSIVTDRARSAEKIA